MIKLSNTTIYKKIPLVCLVLSLAIFVLSMTNIVGGGNIEKAAEKTTKEIYEKIDKLDRAIKSTLAKEPGTQSNPENLAEDIVIYRYVNDSLISWSNLFPIINDNISHKMVFHRLSPFDNRIESPLSNVTQELKYLKGSSAV